MSHKTSVRQESQSIVQHNDEGPDHQTFTVLLYTFPDVGKRVQGNSIGPMRAYPLGTYGPGEALLSPSAGPEGGNG
ncbi:hypothetical protein TNCV_3818201 [Trichonephila clavipes]|nr:hypothetical protein TNCV_3818201 [Trichonephila clavipes]